MADFIKSIEKIYGVSTASSVVGAFDKIRLPIPMSGAYIKSAEGGYILPLERFGCILRLTDNVDYPLLRAPHILQPIASMEIDTIRLDINPGVMLNVNMRDAGKIQRALLGDNIKFFDCFPPMNNTGWVPFKTPEFPQGFPVVIDTGACRRLSDKAVSIASSFNNGGSARRAQNPQIAFYSDLIESFDAAKAQNFDKQRVVAFWQKCIERKAAGDLLSPWTESDFRNLKQVSHNYAQQMALTGR